MDIKLPIPGDVKELVAISEISLAINSPGQVERPWLASSVGSALPISISTGDVPLHRILGLFEP
jgi:hypothetical protein